MNQKSIPKYKYIQRTFCFNQGSWLSFEPYPHPKKQQLATKKSGAPLFNFEDSSVDTKKTAETAKTSDPPHLQPLERDTTTWEESCWPRYDVFFLSTGPQNLHV